MTYEYLIKRFLPFSLGFFTAVLVTSLFQAFCSIGRSPNVPEVRSVSYDKTYACKSRIRGYGVGSGSGIGHGVSGSTSAEGKLSILHKPKPAYTDEARANGTEGTVLLRVTFLPNGEIGSVVPVKSLRDGLTEQAITAARELEFIPAKRNGTPVSVTRQVEYTFSLY